MKKKGFTLIELLVVVAIIAVLVAILLPAISQAQYQAKLLTCSTNLKNWGQYLTMYASDNKDFFPCHGKLKTNWWQASWDNNPNASEYGGYWSYAPSFVNLIYPQYIKQETLFFCPLDQWRSSKRQWPLTQQFYGFSYAYLGSYGTDPTNPGYSLRCKTLSDPVSGIMSDQECWSPQVGWFWNHHPEAVTTFGLIPGTVTVLYTDGRAELLHVGPTWYPYAIASLPN